MLFSVLACRLGCTRDMRVQLHIGTFGTMIIYECIYYFLLLDTTSMYATMPWVAHFLCHSFHCNGIDAEASIGTGGLVSLLTGEQLAGFGNLEQRTHAGTSCG